MIMKNGTQILLKKHVQFIKGILGVNRTTSAVMLRGELERYSLNQGNNKKCQIFESTKFPQQIPLRSFVL